MESLGSLEGLGNKKANAPTASKWQVGASGCGPEAERLLLIQRTGVQNVILTSFYYLECSIHFVKLPFSEFRDVLLLASPIWKQ